MNSNKFKVLVLMSTYNGAKYLKEQIESILSQKNVDIQLLIRDDMSTDSTLSVLNNYQKEYDNIEVIQGENIGAALSFMQLLKFADNYTYDFCAFSDQDDVWLEDKLFTATDHLAKMNQNLPLLYCSKPQLVDENLNHLKTKWLDLNGTFGESMIINASLGCTQVFNMNLVKLTNSFSPSFLMMHDGWLYRICLAVGGCIFYDQNPKILYRQHLNNVVGGKSNFYLKWKRRINAYVRKNSNVRYKTAINLLKGYQHKIPEDNKELLQSIVDYKQSIKHRLHLVFANKIKSNSKEHNCIFKLSVLLGYY